VASQVIAEADLGEQYRRTLNGSIDGGQQRWRRACFDDRQSVTRYRLSRAENCIMKHRMHVAEKHAATQGALSVSKLHSGRESLCGTGDTAANQDQESTRVDRSAPEQRDGRTLDHDVTRQDTGSDGFEFQ
jgi:hypothetical protein